MRKLSVFNFITLNGFYKGPGEDISWHKHLMGAEEQEYSKKGAQSDSMLLFGRITYDMMKSYWPTEMAMQNDPVVADGMNKSEKIVFSKTLKKAEWNNTRVMNGDIVGEMRKMKKENGKSMTLLGSGTILSLFAENGLIDEYMFMLDPVAIGDGTSIFKGISKNLELKLVSSKPFKSGVVLLTYEPK